MKTKEENKAILIIFIQLKIRGSCIFSTNISIWHGTNNNQGETDEKEGINRRN